jgi:hypothetical protein
LMKWCCLSLLNKSFSTLLTLGVNQLVPLSSPHEKSQAIASALRLKAFVERLKYIEVAQYFIHQDMAIPQTLHH